MGLADSHFASQKNIRGTMEEELGKTLLGHGNGN